MTYLATLTSLSDSLIRDEVRVAASRERLLQAARQVVMEGVYSVDEVSASTGLTPAEIRAACDASFTADEDLAKLAGIR